MLSPDSRDFVPQNQGQSSKILKKSDSRDSGNEEEFEILGQKERHHSGDSGNCSEAEETNRAIELEFYLIQSLLSQVEANEGNRDANSGKQAYKDLPRMGFVINGETIDKECILRLYGKNNYLIQSGSEDYRLFAKQVFTGMFNYARAEVPNDNILEELITHCNQAGYEFAMYEKIQHIFCQYSLIPTIPKKTISLYCNSAESVNVEYSDTIVIKNQDPDQVEQYESGSKLEFTLKSQNDKVEYENGKVTLTIPEELKAGRKNLLNEINEHFKDKDNEIIETLEKNMNEGHKSFFAEDLSITESSPYSSEITTKAEADPGILGNVVNMAVGVAEIGAGMITGLWYQDQTIVETKRGEEEFTIVPESLAFDKLVDIINKAKNHDDYTELNKIVNNIKENDRFITNLNHDNLKKFCSQQLNLVAQTDHIYEVLLNNRYDKTNGNYNYSVKELALLAIAADDALVERYAEMHKSILFTQDKELDRLLIGVGRQHYVKFLLKHLELEKKLDTILPWNSTCKKLKRALSISNQECVKTVLDKFKDTEAESRVPDISSKLLHYAIRQDFIDVAETIINHKIVDMNSRDNLGNVPLHWAVARNNLKLISLLIKNGAEVDIKDERYGRTALHWAAHYGRLEIVKFLVKEGANWNVRDKDGKIALDLVNARSKEKPSDESEITKFFEILKSTAPLHHAVENDNLDTAKKLLTKNVDINAKLEDGWTPLGLAIRDGKLNFVELLLNHNADVNIETRNKDTHLFWAIQRNRAQDSGPKWKIVNLLLDKKAKIGKEELKEAIEVANPEVIKLLVSKGAVITEEIVEHAKKVFGNRGGSEKEKLACAKILGFLEGKAQPNSNLVNETATSSQAVELSSQKSKGTDSRQPQDNAVDKIENIMDNKKASIEEAIGNNCEGGKMAKSMEAIEKELSDAIFNFKCEQAKSLVEEAKQEGYNVESIINQAFDKANGRRRRKLSGKSKDKLKSFKKELEQIAGVLSVSDNVETTANSQEVPVVERKESSSSLSSEENKLENNDQSDKSAGTSSGSGSPSFELVNNEIEHEAILPAVTEKVEAKSGSTYAPEAQLTSGDKGNHSDQGQSIQLETSIAVISSVNNNVEGVGATASSQEVPVVERKESSSSLSSEENKLENNDQSDKSAENSSGSSSPFEMVDKVKTSIPAVQVEPKTIPSIATEKTDNEVQLNESSVEDYLGSTPSLTNKQASDSNKKIAPPQLVGDTRQTNLSNLIANEDTQPKSVANGQASDSNKKTAPQNTKRYIVAASALAIAGIALGVAVAVYLEMLVVGAAVAVCCLIVATITYCYRPKSSLEDNKVEEVGVTGSTLCCS